MNEVNLYPLGRVKGGFGFLVQLSATQILENLHKHMGFCCNSAQLKRNSRTAKMHVATQLQLSELQLSCA